METILFIAAVVHAVLVFQFFLIAWMNHGINEKNLVRTILKSLRGLIWPALLIIYLRRTLPTLRVRVVKDWREAFPPKKIAQPSPVDISSLGTSEPKYLPGGWRSE